MARTRTYSELIKFQTFEERYDYLRLAGEVGQSTFGFDRYLNQQFYTSRAWKEARRYVIIRDNSCDLGIEGYDIHSNLLVHHMNPVAEEDILHNAEWICDPEYLITTTHNTHNAIHYSDKSLLITPARERHPGDTKLW